MFDVNTEEHLAANLTQPLGAAATTRLKTEITLFFLNYFSMWRLQDTWVSTDEQYGGIWMFHSVRFGPLKSELYPPPLYENLTPAGPPLELQKRFDDSKSSLNPSLA